MPYFWAARAIAAIGGGNPSDATSRLGSSRNRAPSGTACTHGEGPPVRCAGRENALARVFGTPIESACSMRPVASSRGVIIPPASARLLAVVPQLSCGGVKCPGPVDTWSSWPPHVACHPPCAWRRRQNSQIVSVPGCHTTSSPSLPGAGRTPAGSGTESKAAASDLSLPAGSVTRARGGEGPVLAGGQGDADARLAGGDGVDRGRVRVRGDRGRQPAAIAGVGLLHEVVRNGA